MKNKFLLLIAVFMFSCEDADNTAINDKQGSVEIQLSSKHLDSLHDEITIYRQYYSKSICVSKDTTRDTVISLGKTKEVGEDSLGNKKEFTVRKDYEFFITIK